MSKAYVRADSLFGRHVDPGHPVSGGEPLAVSMNEVAVVQKWSFSPGRTVLAVVGGAALASGTVLAVVALSVDGRPLDR